MIEMDVIYEHPNLTVHLTLFNAVVSKGTPQMLERNDIRWITVDEIDRYAFRPADEGILKKRKRPITTHLYKPEQIKESAVIPGSW